MSSSRESSAGRRPSTTSSPDVASSRPVITQSRVVLPLPLGPTNIVSSPRRIFKLMPRRAGTCVSPRPKTFVTSWEKTAIPSVTMRLTPENDRWFEHENPADAHQACQSDYKEHDHRDARHDLPGQNDPACRRIVQKTGKEGRSHAHAEAVPGGADNHCLQQDHRDDPPIGHTDGLQGAKLFEVLDREDVEGLPGYHTADDESNHHRNAEVHGDAGVAHVKAECIPGKFRGTPCSQSCRSFNAPANLLDGHTGRRLGENEGEQIPLASHKPEGLAVACVKDREALKRCRCVADPNNQDPPVVHLKGLAYLERLTREEILESGFVDNGGVRLVQPVDRSHQHLPRRTDKGRIVYTHENHGAESSVGTLRTARAFVERNRPLDSGHAPNPVQVVIAQCVDFVAIKGLRIHDPDIRVHNVLNLTSRPRHDADENGYLIR